MTFEGQQIQGSAKILEKLQVNRKLNFCYDSSDLFLDFLTNFNFSVVFFNFLQSLTFQKINRVITAIDSQPMFDGGVLISVLGRLQVSIVIWGIFVKVDLKI